MGDRYVLSARSNQQEELDVAVTAAALTATYRRNTSCNRGRSPSRRRSNRLVEHPLPDLGIFDHTPAPAGLLLAGFELRLDQDHGDAVRIEQLQDLRQHPVEPDKRHIAHDHISGGDTNGFAVARVGKPIGACSNIRCFAAALMGSRAGNICTAVISAAIPTEGMKRDIADIGLLSDVDPFIHKEAFVQLRSPNVDSHDGRCSMLEQAVGKPSGR